MSKSGMILCAVMSSGLAGVLVPGSAYANADEASTTGLPSIHMAAFGDSITKAFNTNAPIDHPWLSWSTGNSSVPTLGAQHVKSHAEYLAEETGRNVVTHNVARTGATSSDLQRQVDAVKGIPLTYATMLMGANDLCGDSLLEDGPYAADLANFELRVEKSLTTLIDRNPDIKILLVSVPDLPRLERLGHGTSCQAKWTSFGFCKGLLGADASPDDIERFAHRWQATNNILAAIAARHSNHVLFSWRLAEYPFEREHLSNVDCFHPNVVGQNLLSSETWNSGWWGH